jgi:TRAP-type uncharacterized transport system substrate-binding protein
MVFVAQALGVARMRILAVLTAVAALVYAVLWSNLGIVPVRAQVAIPRAIQQGGPDAELKERKNAWTVGIVGGLISGTYMRFADEMATVLDDGDNLRVLPIVSYGAASNLDDLLYLRGVDLAITQSDVFEYFRTQRKTPGLEHRINYVLRLPISELHILARDEVKTLEDLRGKKVNFGPAGTGASLTGTIVFQRLGINVEQVLIDQPTALQKLRSGEVDAIVRAIGKPIDFFSKIPPNSGLHFVPIPYTKMFEDYYALGEFTPQDYPSLVPAGERVDTIAIPAVLAVFNWSKSQNPDRYRRVERFVEYLFDRWDRFQKPPFHPKWRETNLAAVLPGWNRFPAATEWLQQHQATRPAVASTRAQFDQFLTVQGGQPLSEAGRDRLFQEFLEWRQQQRQ